MMRKGVVGKEVNYQNKLFSKQSIFFGLFHKSLK